MKIGMLFCTSLSLLIFSGCNKGPNSNLGPSITRIYSGTWKLQNITCLGTTSTLTGATETLVLTDTSETSIGADSACSVTNNYSLSSVTANAFTETLTSTSCNPNPCTVTLQFSNSSPIALACPTDFTSSSTPSGSPRTYAIVGNILTIASASASTSSNCSINYLRQ